MWRTGTCLLVLLAVLNFATSWAAVHSLKDAFVTGDGAQQTSKNGLVVGTRAAEFNVPLIAAPVMDTATLEGMRMVTVGYFEPGYGALVKSSLHIARYVHINNTAVEFLGADSTSLKIFNGKAWLEDRGIVKPVCEADTRCSSFRVDGAPAMRPALPPA